MSSGKFCHSIETPPPPSGAICPPVMLSSNPQHSYTFVHLSPRLCTCSHKLNSYGGSMASCGPEGVNLGLFSLGSAHASTVGSEHGIDSRFPPLTHARPAPGGGSLSYPQYCGSDRGEPSEAGQNRFSPVEWPCRWLHLSLRGFQVLRTRWSALIRTTSIHPWYSQRKA